MAPGHRKPAAGAGTGAGEAGPETVAAADLVWHHWEGGEMAAMAASAGLVRRHRQPAAGYTARLGAPIPRVRCQCCRRSTLARPAPKWLPSWRADYGVEMVASVGAAMVASADCWRPPWPAPPRGHGDVWRDSHRGPRDARRRRLMACCAWLVPWPDTPAARLRAMPLALLLRVSPWAHYSSPDPQRSSFVPKFNIVFGSFKYRSDFPSDFRKYP